MTPVDDLDRTLAAWFDADAAAPAPDGLLDQVSRATARRTPKSASAAKRMPQAAR